MNPPHIVVPTRLTVSLGLLATFFVVAGALHLIRPGLYVRIMPPWMPAPMMLVLISGVCEMLGGAGILVPATRAAAGWGLIALLVAVFPANVQMLLNAHADHASRTWQSALLMRLPLQPILIYWVYRSAVRFGQ
jgi:uncharacterized membrane protein